MASNVTRDHHTFTRDTVRNVSGDLTLDIVGDLTLDVAGTPILDSGTGMFHYRYAGDTNDYFRIQVAASGVTKLTTHDSDGQLGHLYLKPDGWTVVDTNITDTTGATYKGLSIDFDKTQATTSNNNLYGLEVDIRNVTATDGLNIVYGLYFKTTLTHAEDNGTAAQYACWIEANGSGNGTSSTEGCRIIATGATTNTGLRIQCDDGGNDFRIVSSADTGDYFQIAVGAAGATTIQTIDDSSGEGADLTFDTHGDIIFKADTAGNVSTEVVRVDSSASSLFVASGKKIEFGDAGENISGDGTNLTITSSALATVDAGTDVILDPNSGITKFYLAGDTDDLCTLTVAADGATTIATVDSDGAVGHLTLAPDGDLILDPVSQKIIINATDQLYLDGGGDTYIKENSADVVLHYVGGDIFLQMVEDGAAGNLIIFKSCAVGFSEIEETFSSDVLANSGSGTGGTHDTDIDFRHTNKIQITVTASMNDMNLIFPGISGNFLLLVKYDGDWAIDSWKAWRSDAAAASGANVLWPGGTEPTTTDSGIDIFSFYWSAEDLTCYGVASLDFQAGN